MVKKGIVFKFYIFRIKNKFGGDATLLMKYLCSVENCLNGVSSL